VESAGESRISSPTDHDVVVVGAGIAGCTAATFLGRRGAKVALVGDAALGDDRRVDRATRRYAKRHRRRLAMHDRVCSAYSTGRRFNPMEKLLSRGAARSDQLAGRFALYGERWVRPQGLLTPTTLALLVRANLAR
jgi:glycine/D-amino acid oxidase-like deaminating enzyme